MHAVLEGHLAGHWDLIRHTLMRLTQHRRSPFRDARNLPTRYRSEFFYDWGLLPTWTCPRLLRQKPVSLRSKVGIVGQR